MPSLVSFAVGFCAHRALKGRTIAAQNILLEPGSAVQVKEPSIIVYSSNSVAEINGRKLLEADSSLLLCFQLLMPCGVEINAANGQWSLDTSSSLSLPFALLWRECEVALSSEQNVWARLYRSFVLNIETEWSTNDLIEFETGMRVAERCVYMKAKTITSPMIGADPYGTWAEFINAMRADTPEIASLADLIHSSIVGGDDLLDWHVDFAYLGTAVRLGTE